MSAHPCRIRPRFAALARLGAALACLVAPPASADCISDCQAEVYCDSQKQWECSRALGECYQRLCPGSGRAPERKPVTGAYGAIAYDVESGAYGMADASKDAAAAGVVCRRLG
jgi:hypothetical protein